MYDELFFEYLELPRGVKILLQGGTPLPDGARIKEDDCRFSLTSLDSLAGSPSSAASLRMKCKMSSPVQIARWTTNTSHMDHMEHASDGHEYEGSPPSSAPYTPLSVNTQGYDRFLCYLAAAPPDNSPVS